jgi:hypothetical protein
MQSAPVRASDGFLHTVAVAILSVRVARLRMSYRGRDINEASSNIFLRPDQSLIVFRWARNANGDMSREAASDQVVTWSKNDGTHFASSLWRDQAVPAPSC